MYLLTTNKQIIWRGWLYVLYAADIFSFSFVYVETNIIVWFIFYFIFLFHLRKTDVQTYHSKTCFMINQKRSMDELNISVITIPISIYLFNIYIYIYIYIIYSTVNCILFSIIWFRCLIGLLAVAGKVQWIRVCPSVHPSFFPAVVLEFAHCFFFWNIVWF